MKRRGVQRANDARRTGGWLITYADLMTILVCFFVLIVSYSIQDQVKMEVVAGSIREAFGVAEKRRYAGDYALDGTPEQKQPGNIRPNPNPSANAITDTLTANPASGSHGRDGAFETADARRRPFEDAAARIEKAILTHPLLKDQSEAVTVTLVEDGLQVVLIDADGAPMFEIGSSRLTATARAALEEVTRAITPLANRVTIEGHADATGSGRYSPFDLTAARANAAREIMEAAGLPSARIAGVAGRGAAAPLIVENPYAAGNRRIEILLEPAAPVTPDDLL